MKICIFEKNSGTFQKALKRMGAEVIDVVEEQQFNPIASLMKSCSLLLVHITDRGWETAFEKRPAACLAIKYTDNFAPDHFVVEDGKRVVECTHTLAKRRVPAMVYDAIRNNDKYNIELLRIDPQVALTKAIHELFLLTLPARVMYETGYHFSVMDYFTHQTSVNAVETGQRFLSLKTFIRNIEGRLLPSGTTTILDTDKKTGRMLGRPLSFEWPRGEKRTASLKRLNSIVKNEQVEQFLTYCQEVDEALRKLRTAVTTAPLSDK